MHYTFLMFTQLSSVIASNSDFASALPLILLIITVLLLIAVAILGFMVVRLQARLNTFLLGQSTNLDESITTIKGSLTNFEAFRKELEAYLLGVEKRLKRSVQSVHTIRYNPFKGSGFGSNQSFATALLNEDGDGVVISSLYSREHVSVFSKPIKKLQSEFELSDEEKNALEEARKSM